jgi:hypothetical protein
MCKDAPNHYWVTWNGQRMGDAKIQGKLAQISLNFILVLPITVIPIEVREK